MNKKEYLELKQRRKANEFSERELCLECYRPETACFCGVITPFHTNTSFRILLHPLEAKRNQVGTGRMANKALSNCEIITGEGFENCPQVNRILDNPVNECFLLYPSVNSVNLSEEKLEVSTEKNQFIFILDSTWACSKKMIRLSPNIASLPRISFEPNYLSRFDIKRQPKKYCLSTIESIYRVLQELENQNLENVGEKKETLRSSLATMVDYHQKCAANPFNKKYRH